MDLICKYYLEWKLFWYCLTETETTEKSISHVCMKIITNFIDPHTF